MIKDLIKIKKVEYPFVRIGKNNDGGYIMLDDFKEISEAFSFGINYEMSWDVDIAKRIKNKVHMFDHTNKDIKVNDKCVFYSIGVSNISGGQFLSLEKIFKMRESDTTERDLLLKMDIEGDEYKVLDACPIEILDKFRQITIEFHDTHIFDETKQKVISKLNQIHEPIWVHGNNCCPVINGVPRVLEVTYANKNCYKFAKSDISFPLSIDMPNIAGRQDHILGVW